MFSAMVAQESQMKRWTSCHVLWAFRNYWGINIFNPIQPALAWFSLDILQAIFSEMHYTMTTVTAIYYFLLYIFSCSITQYVVCRKLQSSQTTNCLVLACSFSCNSSRLLLNGDSSGFHCYMMTCRANEAKRTEFVQDGINNNNE